jgi:hypothetical protein
VRYAISFLLLALYTIYHFPLRLENCQRQAFGNVAGLEESESFYIFGEAGTGMFGGSNTDHRGSMSSGKIAVDCDPVPTASMYAAINLAGEVCVLSR